MHIVGYLVSHMLPQTRSPLEEASVSVLGSVTMHGQFTDVKGQTLKVSVPGMAMERLQLIVRLHAAST